ncbi:hypothetical protein EU534_02120 [Candidatus Heimdallarchaeota archaeon]|nr:MAG: hypothetical protein EU534_02120 [Candidatus Heimdallarchaeota archaeon]
MTYREEYAEDYSELDNTPDEDIASLKKLPFIEFKDHIEEEKEDQRFQIFFSLIFAIIGAIIVVAIPIELLIPANLVIGDLDISTKLPLIQSVAGAVIGAFLGSAVGFILDLWVNSYRLNKKRE